jgi:hypothetical protein
VVWIDLEREEDLQNAISFELLVAAPLPASNFRDAVE